MIKKQLLISLLLFLSFFCLTTISAQTKKGKQPLIEILDELHSKFECNFSFIDDDIKDISVEPPPDNYNLSQYLSYLEEHTGLIFTNLGKNFITITKKNRDGFSVCGYLIDIATNQVVRGAVVQSKGNSTVSDEKGYFELKRIEEDALISIRHLGYDIITEYIKPYISKNCTTIFMTPKIENLNEIVLTNLLTNGMDKVIDGSISINYKNFGTIPGLIETDPLQTIQALAGFQSVDETISNLNIRGGTHDQNLILWDGIKIYQSGHFFGLISTMNPRMTKKVALFKNGTPASYTDGVSGTIDMKTDHLVTEDLNAEVGLNFINLDAFVDVPLGKNSSLQLASRTSINEYFNTPTYNQYYDRVFQNTDLLINTNTANSTNQKFDFNDVSLRWIYDISNKDQVRLNFLFLNNGLSLSENIFTGNLSASRESMLDQRNLAGGFNYHRKWSNKFSSFIQLYGTDYNLNAVNFDIANEQILTQKNKILETSVVVNTNYRPNDQIRFNAGYQFTETGITNENKLNYPVIDESKKEVIRTHGLFTEVTWATRDLNTHIKLGTRFNYMEPFGEFFIEPRLSLNHKLTERFSIQILGEFKNQSTTFITDFKNNFLGVENRRWVLSNNYNLPILKSKQASLGANYNFEGLVINGEIYYKNVDGISSISQGFQNQYEDVDADGSYDVKGLDFIIGKKWEKFNTWLSYSYADNDYSFDEFEETTLPSNLDITHSASLLGSYAFNNIKLSAGYNWRTGKPYTIPSSDNEIVNNEINYNSANSNNLGPYQRLDASAIYNFEISNNVKAEAGLSILNLLNQKNEINRYYTISDENTVKEVNEYSLGRTPNFALRIFF